MVIYKSKFVAISYDPEKSLIVDKFLPETRNMFSEDFKNEMKIFAEKCVLYRPKRELVHLLNMEFAIGPELQDWMNETIFPHYQNIIKRMAFVMPTELVANLSVEQTMDSHVAQTFTQKYFDNEKLAIEWLIME